MQRVEVGSTSAVASSRAAVIRSSSRSSDSSLSATAAGLGRAEHVALPALLQVELGQLEPVGGGRDRVEPLAGR